MGSGKKKFLDKKPPSKILWHCLCNVIVSTLRLTFNTALWNTLQFLLYINPRPFDQREKFEGLIPRIKKLQLIAEYINQRLYIYHLACKSMGCGSEGPYERPHERPWERPIPILRIHTLVKMHNSLLCYQVSKDIIDLKGQCSKSFDNWFFN